MMEKTSKTLQHTNKTIKTALYQQKALHFIFFICAKQLVQNTKFLK